MIWYIGEKIYRSKERYYKDDGKDYSKDIDLNLQFNGFFFPPLFYVIFRSNVFSIIGFASTILKIISMDFL